MASFRSRAVSLLRPSLLSSHNTIQEEVGLEKGLAAPSSSTEPLNEKVPIDEARRDKSLSLSSAGKPSNPPSDPAATETHQVVRTIPTWVHPLNEDDGDGDPSSHLLPLIPPDAQLAQHNSHPTSKHKDPPRGRLFDLQREWAPPTQSAPFSQDASRWRAFARSSAYPIVSADGEEHVTEEWLVQNGADYSRPWLANSENGDAENEGAHLFQAKRKVWWKRAKRTVLRSPMIPLVIRTVVWVFSLIALALGCSIHNLLKKSVFRPGYTDPSPNMAIIVDAIALVYILYITYDEYSGKPLGLRSAKAKMRLIFLDLFFIVFDSANLSLAFSAVMDSGSLCGHPGPSGLVCRQQKALATVLLIALIAWLMTFSISVARLVERVTGR